MVGQPLEFIAFKGQLFVHTDARSLQLQGGGRGSALEVRTELACTCQRDPPG